MAAVALGGVLGLSPAQAAVVDGGPSWDTDSPGQAGDLQTRAFAFTAATGERNSLRVTRSGSTIVFRDRLAPVTAAGHGCRAVARHTVRCQFSSSMESPDYADNIDIATHAGNDSVVVGESASALGFTTIKTGSGEDRVRMTGAAEIATGPGNDLASLRDADDVTSLDCGTGRDRYVARVRPSLRRCERRLPTWPF